MRLLIVAVLASCGVEHTGSLASEVSFEAHAPCPSPASYVSRGVVQFFFQPPFSPPCLRLAAGGGATVVFQGDLSKHPLVPRSAPSPIEPTNYGGSIEFEIPDYGFFPYRCGVHPEETGVIWANWQ